MDILAWLRTFRIIDFAIFDLVLAFGGMWLVGPRLSGWMRKLGLEVPRVSWLYFTLPISVVAHVLVGSWTPMTLNFFDPIDHVVLKAVIIISTLLGLRGITKTKELRNIGCKV